MRACGLKAALNSSGRHSYKHGEAVVDHLVVGGGVVGLAVARLMAKSFPEKTTYLVERNERWGEESSSRNSEVIHAGLYYPANSLKASLCIRGRELLYRYCVENSVPFRKVGKLVVALPHQREYIQSLHDKANAMQWPQSMDKGSSSLVAVPTELVSGDQARGLEPDLSPDIAAALVSHETGILDSHAFMEKLEQDIMESENAEVVYASQVVRVDPYDRSRQSIGSLDIDAKEDGWVVQVRTGDAGSETNSLLARTLINTTGLSAQLILNSLIPFEDRIPMYYARGSYASYKGPGISNVSRLIYPCPDTDRTGHAFQALGTHLTLDLSGNVKFGPDLQWISPDSPGSDPHAIPTRETNERGEEHHVDFSYDEADVDFWKRYLVPDESLLEAMCTSVRTFLPGIECGKLRPDYVGVRPKLVPPWGGFQDFVFRTDHSETFLRSGEAIERQKPGSSGTMISLLGIESPGLTASLAIAEKVAYDMLGGSKKA